MKHNRTFMRSIVMLLWLVFAAVGCRQDGATVDEPRQEAADSGQATLRQPVGRQSTAALLSDGRSARSVCTPRQQRVQSPTSGSNWQRTPGKWSQAWRLQHQPLIPLTHCHGERATSAPAGFVASRLYYVIALRHIIR